MQIGVLIPRFRELTLYLDVKGDILPRIRSTEMKLRDEEIIAAARRNRPRRDIALEYGISEARVSQIVTQNLDPRYPDEDLRAWLLEGYFGDLLVLQEIKEGPGRPITSGKGDHVIDAVTGVPAYDPSPRNDAVRTAAQVRKNIAMLMGNEKPPPKAAEESPEVDELISWAKNLTQEVKARDEEITRLRARLAVLEGTVEAEVTS